MNGLTKERALMYYRIIKEPANALFDNLVYAAFTDSELDDEEMEKFATSAIRSALLIQVLVADLPKEITERVYDAEEARLREMVK